MESSNIELLNLIYRIFMIAAPLVSVMFSSIVHESAHGYAAYKLGDPTAKNQGRISLNPLKHLDMFGSVILPILLVLSGGPVFAYAKPVPFNPNNLKNPERDETLVALAGPFSNILQALVAGIILYFIPSEVSILSPLFWFAAFLTIYITVNCSLAFFNLLPIPPLDGSKIISLFVKGEARITYQKIQAYSMPILMILLYVVPSLLGFSPISAYLNATAYPLADAIIGLGA